jgi:hypothetical protein
LRTQKQKERIKGEGSDKSLVLGASYTLKCSTVDHL